EPLHKVTIIPRGPSLGSTMWLPEEDKFTNRKNELLDQLVVTMGGRVAEEVVFGDVTNGASGDIRQATHMARKMVCEWGMSDELGMIEYGDHQEHLFLARELSSPRNYSEATAQKIDAEVKRLIDTAYAKATDLIVSHRDKLNAIAKGLLEYETLDAGHIREIMEFGELRNPPSSPTPPDLPEEPAAPVAPPAKPSRTSEDDLPGDLAPAGA
ncbi:MAG: cell division protein FtsH, partial [Verrucomicrobiae bacterium]|nr:cell division protein FtsH [Verrucomicrobiae bacterium]